MKATRRRRRSFKAIFALYQKKGEGRKKKTACAGRSLKAADVSSSL